MEKIMNKDFFIKRYKQLGEDFKEIKLKPSLRVNTLKINHQEFNKRLEKIGVKLEKIKFTKDGYYFDSKKFSLGAITEFLLGYYYLQEAAAQLSVEVLNPLENEIVLDACAAPGGKTTQISQIMKNKGLVVALELKKHRITSLKSSLERLGVNNVALYQMDAIFADQVGIKFDKILLDAPCSGNFASDEHWFEKRDINGVNKSAKTQRQLLKKMCDLLKEKGILVYSTCSLEPEENELNVDWALKNLPLKLEQISLSIGDKGLTEVFGHKLNNDVEKCRRLWPWKTNTQGFFIARFVKNYQSETSSMK